MCYKKKIISAISFLFFSLFFTFPVHAQEIDCSDYYHFQSVQVNVGTDKDNYLPQEDVIFKGTLENQNDYPIVNGGVFVRISQKNPNYIEEGNFIVDEFFPLEDVVLDAKTLKDVRFSWRIPKGSVSGDYEADFFFSVGKKFNLGGIPFADGVAVSLADFKISSPNENTALQFDRSAVTVNGEKYRRDGNLSGIEPGKSVTIVQPMKNASNLEDQAEVQYDLYFWDSLDEKDKVASKKELVTMPAGQAQNLTYTIPEMKESVYLLKITATSRVQKSIANIRLLSEQIRPMLNFPAITKFPLARGNAETIFTCFGSSSGQSSSDNKVVAILSDKDGNEVGRMEYQGDIAGDMGGAKNDFTVKDNYDWLKLTASITDKNGAVVDNYEAVYDCNNINPDKCLAGPLNRQTIKKATILTVEIIILSFLIVLVIYLRKRWIAKKNIYVFLLFLVSSFLFFGIKGAGATIISSSPGSSWTVNSSGKVDYTLGVVPNSSCTGTLGQCTNYSMSATAAYPRRLYLDVNDTMAVGATFSPTTPAVTPFTLTKSGSSVPYTYCSDVTNLSTCNPITWLRDHTYSGTPSGTNPATFNLTFDSALLVKTNPIYATSNNTAIFQCSGQNCTAVGPGIARITYTIPGYAWRGAYHVYGTGTVGGVPKNFDTQYVNNNQSGSTGDTNLSIDLQVVAGTSLNVNKSGAGTGTVTSSPAGINCGSTCSANFVGGTVILTAIPDSGSALTSWTGCTVDPSDRSKCSVVMDQIRNVTATFDFNFPPSNPVLTGPSGNVGAPNTDYTFLANSTDPENDQLQYAFDWNKDSTADVWYPGLAAYVDSGTNGSAVKQWPEGLVNLQVKACDIKGACSSWTSYSLTIGTPGVCGPAEGSYSGSDTTLREGFCSQGIPSPFSTSLLSTYTSPSGGTAFAVHVVGDYAYVAYGDSGLEIVNISDPANPQRIGTTGPMGSTSWNLSVSGNRAYVANDSAGLKIVDISNPSSPYVVGTYDPTDDVHDVRVVGNYAFLACNDQGFRVVNISNEISPTLAYEKTDFKNSNGIEVFNNYAYVAAQPGLRVFNISNPTAPVQVGQLDLTWLVGSSMEPTDVRLAGKYAFLTNVGFTRVDISNPASPTYAGAFDNGFGLASFIAGKYGYVADADLGVDYPPGLRIYDIANDDNYYPPNLSYVPTTLETSNDAYGVYLSGNYVYMTNTGSGLKIFKINNYTIPDPGGNIHWECSGTGGLDPQGCDATRSAGSSYVCGDSSLCSYIECGDRPICVSSSGPPVFVDPSIYCASLNCPVIHCECPQDPTTTPPPGSRSWRESNPEKN